jgi:N-acetylmuramoyl-L-alanine amidase
MLQRISARIWPNLLLVRALFPLLVVLALVFLAIRVAGDPGVLSGLSAAAEPSGGVRVDAPGTASSACFAYAPTGPSKHHVIFIDPGHGGPDPGATGQTPSGAPVEEKVETLAVAQTLATRLRGDGYQVVLSRTEDTLVADGLNGPTISAADERRDLQARIDCANTAQAEAWLSIHFNGFEDPSAGGTETFYDSARPFAAQNLRLARSVQSALVRATGLQDRGAVSDDRLDAPTLSDAGAAYGHLIQLGPAQPGLVSRASAMPGALTEPLFVTEPSEAAMVASTDGSQRIAGALASGLESFLT